MRLLQFEKDGRKNIGVELSKGGDIIDLSRPETNLPNNMKDFIKGGQQTLLTAKSVEVSGKYVIKRESVKILAPISDPEKVLCVGMNYKDHCEELNTPLPDEPVVFNKFPSCIIGPTDDLEYPEETEKLDWEAELTIVIGKEAKRIEESEAMDYIFGFTVAHDVTARDWQTRNGGQVVIGKAMDGFCPLGPVIVTQDDILDPHNLRLSCCVNGDVKQDSNTNQLIHKSAAIVSYISRFITLKPGDLILTGTPPGIGVARNPPEFLQRGDIVECEIEAIGKLRNRVV